MVGRLAIRKVWLMKYDIILLTAVEDESCHEHIPSSFEGTIRMYHSRIRLRIDGNCLSPRSQPFLFIGGRVFGYSSYTITLYRFTHFSLALLLRHTKLLTALLL